MDFAQDDGPHQMLLPKFMATEAIGEQPTAKSRRAEQGRCRVNRLSGLVFDGVWLRWHGIGLHRFSWLVGGALNFVVLTLAPLDFAAHIPASFFEVFDGVILEVGPPYVFHRVSEAEVHALSHLYALHAGRVLRVVRRMVHGVHRVRTMCCCQRGGA